MHHADRGKSLRSSEGRQPSYIDVRVGSRIKMQRASLGMSQTRLGAALGITFQQVQKYEKGINRVGASRLRRRGAWSHNLVLLRRFTPRRSRRSTIRYGHDLMSFLSTPEGFEVNRAFAKIADAKLRRQLASLVTAIATTDISRRPSSTVRASMNGTPRVPCTFASSTNQIALPGQPVTKADKAARPNDRPRPTGQSRPEETSATRPNGS